MWKDTICGLGNVIQNGLGRKWFWYCVHISASENLRKQFSVDIITSGTSPLNYLS